MKLNRADNIKVKLLFKCENHRLSYRYWTGEAGNYRLSLTAEKLHMVRPLFCTIGRHKTWHLKASPWLLDVTVMGIFVFFSTFNSTPTDT